MNSTHSSRILTILVAIAVVISLGFGVLLLHQEQQRRSDALEYHAFQVLTGIMERYDHEGILDTRDWSEVRGLGIYNTNGKSIIRYGSAPYELENTEGIPPRGTADLKHNTLTLIRRTGSMPVFKKARPSAPPIFPPVMMARKNLLLFIEIDVKRILAGNRLVYAFVYSMLSVFFIILALLFVYSKRLASFQREQQRTARLVELGEAARTLAHEIKNPLGIIRVQCATLRRTVPRERHGNIDIIEEETARLVNLTDKVREFLQSDEGSPVEIHPEDIIQACQQRWGEKITVLTPIPVLSPIFIDSGRLVQILDNLISNALEATSVDGKPPELSVEHVHGKILFQVKDYGCGIPPEARTRIFEPFYTTKARGSGIGLALALRYATQAGGTITWSESSSKGSLFTVSMPVYPEKGWHRE